MVNVLPCFGRVVLDDHTFNHFIEFHMGCNREQWFQDLSNSIACTVLPITDEEMQCRMKMVQAKRHLHDLDTVIDELIWLPICESIHLSRVAELSRWDYHQSIPGYDRMNSHAQILAQEQLKRELHTEHVTSYPVYDLKLTVGTHIDNMYPNVPNGVNTVIFNFMEHVRLLELRRQQDIP